MTEAEWLACADPTPMLAFVAARTTERKLHLFACACARRVFPEMDHDGSRALVELTERFIEGFVTAEELTTNRRANYRHCVDSIPEWEYVNSADTAADCAAVVPIGVFAEHAASWAVRGKVRPLLRPINAECFGRAFGLPSPFVGNTLVSPTAIEDHTRLFLACMEPRDRAETEFTRQEQLAQSLLLHDIFGNPFHPVAFDPAWRTEAVVGPARGVYEDRAFDRLPVLADALEDAGCADAAVLAHCRGPGPHVRGCWVVDLVLGKN